MLNKLKVQRSALLKQMEDIRTEAKAGNFTSEQEEKFDNLLAEEKKVMRSIEREQEYLERAKIEFLAADVAKEEKEKIDRKASKPDDTAALCAWAKCQSGIGDDAAVEICRKAGVNSMRDNILISRALEAGTTTEGGFLVPTGLVQGFVAAQDSLGVVRSRATTIMTSKGGKIVVPYTNDTANVATLVDEEAAVTGGTDPVFGGADLTPYKYTSKIITVSRELLQDSEIGFAAMLGTLLGNRCVRGQEKALTQGSGSSAPQGFLYGGTSATTAASATVLTADEIITCAAALPTYSKNSNTCWMMNMTTLGEIRKLVDGSGAYLLARLSDGVDTIQGIPIVVNDQMPDTATGLKPIAVGDFSVLYNREVNGVELFRSDHVSFANDQVAFIAYFRFGSAMTQATAVQYITMG